MKNKSYLLLKNLEEDLIKSGIDNLPLRVEESQLLPLVSIYTGMREKIKQALFSDLKDSIDEKIEVDFTKDSFFVQDLNAQGATYLILYLDISLHKNLLKLVVKYILFENKILVSLDSEYANQDNYKGENQKLIKMFSILKKGDQEGYKIPLELKYLTLNK